MQDKVLYLFSLGLNLIVKGETHSTKRDSLARMSDTLECLHLLISH